MSGWDTVDTLFTEELDRVRMLRNVESIEVFEEP